MRTADFAPLWRSTIGFDRLFDLAESAQRTSDNYPPCNIERLDEDRYAISLALAGSSLDEIDNRRAERADGGGRRSGKARAYLPLSRHFEPAIQAPVQPGRLCPGEGRQLR
jgi:hypothetical protein